MFTRRQRITVLSLVVLAAAFRIAIVHYLPNDSTDDSLGYEQIARNVLEHHVYTHVAEPPYTPTLVRLPGYPLFLAAIYSVFGHTNNTAVRIVQALIDAGTCILAAVLAWLWQPDERRKMATAIAALALAAVNPFTTIYAATILTEVPATFLVVAACIAATLAFREEKLERELRWWAVSGLLISVGVLFRPDLGLAAAAVGITLVVARFFSGKAEDDPKRRRRFALPAHSIVSRIFLPAAVFTVAFVLVLAPWTIRNWRTLHVFQPLAPLNANMPGEFTPLGYEHWLKTWMTDGDYLDDLLWDLDKNQIDVDELPDSAFDSQGEHDRVSELFDQYNGPEDENASDNETAAPASSPSPSPGQSANKGQPANNSGDENSEDTDEADQENDAKKEQKMGTMTPEIDAGFGQIAAERIARHPFRYYVLLPLRRAHSLWFNTHSDYYPFTGNALPLRNPDNSPGQNFWLPIFAVLVAIYTVLGVGGFVLLVMNGGADGRIWVLLVALIFATRLALFSMAVSVEPRYVVEFFPFLFAAGGLAMVALTDRFRRTKEG
jgi:dolichyl-phosphate-mannose-protein mannosyltransferase